MAKIQVGDYEFDSEGMTQEEIKKYVETLALAEALGITIGLPGVTKVANESGDSDHRADHFR